MQTRILIAHPGATQPLFEMVGVVHRLGYETRFWTGYVFDPEGWIERLTSALPNTPRQRLMRDLERRRSDAIPTTAVTRLPWLEFATIGSLRFLPRGIVSSSRLLGLRNAFFDRRVAREVRRMRPAAVIAVDSAARDTIRAASASGVRSILHQSIGHVAIGQRILEEEASLKPEWADSMPLQMPAHLIDRACQEALEADVVLASSNYVRRTLLEIGVSAERIRDLPYGVRIDRFAPAPPGQRTSDEKFRILYVGQISQRKGIAYLLEAVRTLGRKDIEVTLVGSIIGRGRGLAPYLDFIRHVDNRPHSELPAVYRNADLFVYPSLHEGSAQAIMEAMASGLPAIVTPNAGSLVRDGVEGYIVPIRDANLLARKIDALYRDRERLRDLGTAARRRMAEFSWRTYQDGLAHILMELTGGPGSS